MRFSSSPLLPPAKEEDDFLTEANNDDGNAYTLTVPELNVKDLRSLFAEHVEVKDLVVFERSAASRSVAFLLVKNDSNGMP